jgi:MYXO-CTERM domain-containing protein
MLKPLLLSVVAGATALGGVASAQSATAVGLDDFSIHTVGEGLFGPTRRNALDSRFQVNGSNPNPSDRNYGLWTAFNLDGGSLFAGDITQLASVRIDLFGAVPITGQDVPSVIEGGDLQVYFTTDSSDVLASSNGFVWDTSSSNGLGSQFSDLTLVGSTTLVRGTQDVSFDVDLSAIGSTLVDRINAGEQVRFLFTSPTMDFASSWGVGVPGTSTVLAFDGPAPTVTFTVPAPGAAAVLAGVGLVGLRRRR